MGERVQYYMVFDPKVPGLDFESGAIPEAGTELDVIAERLGLPSHLELFSYAAQDDLCPPEYREKETPWFEAQVGIDWLEAVGREVRARPKSVPDAEALLADFAKCVGVLRRAKEAGARWHFAMDI